VDKYQYLKVARASIHQGHFVAKTWVLGRGGTKGGRSPSGAGSEAAADYIIDLGPGVADEGGQVVVKGTPEMVANCANSMTGRFLGGVLQKNVRDESA
jgi:hypothetical protein